MKKYMLKLGLLMAFTLLALPGSLFAQSATLSSTFSYQGSLNNTLGAVSNVCDFQFGLFDSLIAGSQIGSTLTRFNIVVTNGVFSVQLDFGSTAFASTDRYLEVALRCPAGTGTYTTLTPRQSLTPTPYAIGLYGLQVQQNATSTNLIGGFSGNTVTAGVVGATINGGGATGTLNRVSDDFGSVGGGGGNIVGNGDGTFNNAFYATVGGGQSNTASAINATVGGGQSNTASGASATVGGGSGNIASGASATVGGGQSNAASAQGATVSGGQSNAANFQFATVSGGSTNTASGSTATVGGGSGNTASGASATVGGGQSNAANFQFATVSGGQSNNATADSATVGGGDTNIANIQFATVSGGQTNTGSGDSATVGGGQSNTASGTASTVGGGQFNSASDINATVAGGGSNLASAFNTTVAGGNSNTASGTASTVGGGLSNTASGGDATISGGISNAAKGGDATVSGGNTNSATDNFATVGGGQNNQAGNNDATLDNALNATVSGGSGNTASGNFTTVSGGAGNIATFEYATVSGGQNNVASGAYSIVAGGFGNSALGDNSFAAGQHAQANHEGAFVWGDNSTVTPITSTGINQFIARATGGVEFVTSVDNITGDPATGVFLLPGDGGWNDLSDRNAKGNFEGIDPQTILQGVVNLPLSTWNYNSQDPSIRHIGPMAQDFSAAFNLGIDDKHISTIDADGVALGAIQGLYQITQNQKNQLQLKDQRITDLENKNATLQTQLDDLDTRLAALEKSSGPAYPPTESGLPLVGVVGAFVIGGAWLNRRKTQEKE